MVNNVAVLFQFPYVPGIPLLPVRRVIAIDPGSHSLKLIVAESFRDQMRILQQKNINLSEEGLLSPEEIGPFVRNALREIGDYPIAVTLPQRIPLSQLVDLSTTGSNGVKQLIEQETLKNRDMHDSPIVYDCVKLPPFGKHQNSFWVTLCKEKDIFAQINRLSLITEDVCEVATGANVLAAAYRLLSSQIGPAVLVDFGASSTLVVIVVEGQPVHAVSFAIGGNLLTETIANQNKCSLEAAENLKRSKHLFSGSDVVSGLLPAIDSWRNEIERIVADWWRENPEVPSDFPVVLCGGNAPQHGLLEYLNRDRKERFTLWPRGTEKWSPQFAGAYGTALQALRTGRASGSLMPEELRGNWAKQRIHQRILSATFLLLAIVVFLLLAGTGQKLSHARQKRKLLHLAQTALEKNQNTAALQQEAVLAYERLRPVLKRQQQALDTLSTLSLINQTRTNQNLWYVLLTDQQSYFTGHTAMATNLIPGSVADASKRGFVAELCINEEGEVRRRTLRQIVASLKQSSLFSNVDTLPADRRKNLANPKVLLPEHHFALALELAGDEFEQSMLSPEPSSEPSATSPSLKDSIRMSPTNRTAWPMTNDF